MSKAHLILTLAKVIIAAAWADGEMSNEEINSLKDLLFHLPHSGRGRDTQLSGREWAMLEMYIESPVSPEERAVLIEQLQNALRTPADRELALSALQELVHADGVVTPQERAVVQEIRNALESVDLNIINQLGRLIRGPIQRRSQVVAGAGMREEHLDDFIKNKVYYAVRRRLDLDEAEDGLDISEAKLRKLSLAGGLMARVAHVDDKVTEDELEKMTRALQKGWELSREHAAIVAQVAASEAAADLDPFRLTRQFTTHTTHTERARFLNVLFAVADADGKVSHEEIEEIRRLARGLNLAHRHFIDAKLKIPRERRTS
jgi:uncharacterized tellurite resistance protein B-like protein